MTFSGCSDVMYNGWSDVMFGGCFDVMHSGCFKKCITQNQDNGTRPQVLKVKAVPTQYKTNVIDSMAADIQIKLSIKQCGLFTVEE